MNQPTEATESTFVQPFKWIAPRAEWRDINRMFRLRRLGLGILASAQLALSAEAPRDWPPDAFNPVTRERIAKLPETDRQAWATYLDTSDELLLKIKSQRSSATSNEFRPNQGTGALHSRGVRLGAPSDWYASEEARAIASRVVTRQTVAGAWTKGNDYTQPNAPSLGTEGGVWERGTFDNDATTSELRFLALVNAASPEDERATSWRAAFLSGLGYVFAARYPNGGYPQIYPLAGGYHDNITFNDEAMIHALELLRDVSAPQPEFKFVPAASRQKARDGLEHGIQCILATQIRNASGQPTVWAQQHDALTLLPAAARDFEPIGACSRESSAITEFLMSLSAPSPEITAAVSNAMKWFRSRALTNLTWTGFGDDPRIIVTPDAPQIWARLYELETDKPIFGDRDRRVHYDVSEVSLERRRGYGWYGDWPSRTLRKFEAWQGKR